MLLEKELATQRPGCDSSYPSAYHSIGSTEMVLFKVHADVAWPLNEKTHSNY